MCLGAVARWLVGTAQTEGEGSQWTPGFRVADMLVWGFTGMIVDRLLSLGGWELPWRREGLTDVFEATPQGLRPVG